MSPMFNSISAKSLFQSFISIRVSLSLNILYFETLMGKHSCLLYSLSKLHFVDSIYDCTIRFNKIGLFKVVLLELKLFGTIEYI